MTLPIPNLKVLFVYARFVVPRAWEVLREKFWARIHRLTYRDVSPSKNVVVIGGSFGGIELTRTLAKSLPTGYRVVLIDKNSHFNYTFNFPRYSVLQGHEQLAFIPYDGIGSGSPDGIYRQIQGEVTSVDEHVVGLASGEEIPYEFLVFATGATQTPPARLRARNADEAQAELRVTQESIKSANRIAVVGGGAVGVELATDIKDYYPEKSVTLVHSRTRLLPRFDNALHEEVMTAMSTLGVETILGERPQIASHLSNGEEGTSEKLNQHTMVFSDGRAVDYDLIIPCTGQKPNSDLLVSLEPHSISNITGRILTQPTLQISCKAGPASKIFAFGDVAETKGTLMARSAWYQARIVQQNIIAMIKGKHPTAHYAPNLEVEGALKLTVGKSNWIMYVKPSGDKANITSYVDGKEDLDAYSAWAYYGADSKSASIVAPSSIEIM